MKIKLDKSSFNQGLEKLKSEYKILAPKTTPFKGTFSDTDITKYEEIRTIEVTNNVSNVAKIKEVRYLMVDVQREIGTRNSVILDGRDIGSYVFPNADYKFYLIATPEERGNRRYKELVEKGVEVKLEDVISDIIRRDEIDSNREFAPLVKADDAIEIDTTGKTIDDVVEAVIEKIQ